MFRINVLLLLAAQVPETMAIYGGVTTLAGDHPYFVDLLPGDGRLQHCGGALVAPDIVLTHPQCAPLDVEAHIGWYSTSDEGQTLNFFPKDTLPAIVHPLYDEHSFDYGFMLVKLQSSSTQPFLKLNSDPSIPASTTELEVMGRGNRQDVGVTTTGQINLGKAQNRLDVATLPYIETGECQKARSLGDWTYTDVIADSLFCAGSEQFGACEDDWGSPIVIKNANPSEHVLVGIFAWTYGCRPTPSVFSRVSSGYDWLRWTICQNSENAPSYLNCQAAVDPQIGPRQNPPNPQPPIGFRWSFDVDDYYYENCAVLERIDGLDVQMVDLVVPGAIPYGFESTYTRELTLQKGALYSLTVFDANQNEMGQAEYFLQSEETGEYESIFSRSGDFRGVVNHIFYATLDEDDIEFPYYNIPSYTNSSAGFLTMEIKFDDRDFPSELGWELVAEDGTLIIYRPPRYYTGRAGDKVQETFAMPPKNQDYILRVADTYGDGMVRQSSYKLMDPNENVLVESRFRDVPYEETTFTYNPNTFDEFAVSTAQEHFSGTSIMFAFLTAFVSAGLWYM